MPEGKFTLRRKRLDSGGYDRTGRYYGVGQPLFEYQDDGDIYDEIRADDRDHAIAKITAKYPGCTFYRGIGGKP